MFNNFCWSISSDMKMNEIDKIFEIYTSIHFIVLLYLNI